MQEGQLGKDTLVGGKHREKWGDVRAEVCVFVYIAAVNNRLL